MLHKILFRGRFSLLFHFMAWFVATSFLVRLSLLLWQAGEVSGSIPDTLRTFAVGAFFDTGTATLLALPALVYFTFFPDRWVGSWADRIAVWFFLSLTVFLLVFAFFAEFTFWEEFRSRFNFIAVDYLIYTHEVVANIRESYPLPLLVGGVALFTVLFLWLFRCVGAFAETFANRASLRLRSGVAVALGAVAAVFVWGVRNSDAEWSSNRYNSELSKSGVYSFFAAFRNNQMKYPEFYTTLGNDQAFALLRSQLKEDQATFTGGDFSIHRRIIEGGTQAEARPNVVCILVESLSGSFLEAFGNEKRLTPFLDSLAQKSMFFSDLYATGTRTVRGMEAMTLCIPPTPGQSIVKRPENANLYTVSNVFSAKGYTNRFFYGGDGYFDNMNAYFGGNGFTIYDRGRGSVLSDAIKTVRHHITDQEVTFENAWGICDEDLYDKMLRVADAGFAGGKPFFHFLMTTSNHRPYTYPSGKIDIPSGTSREGAVRYTDYALRQLFAKARTRPWFRNTVFLIVADHCASSAGKDEIDVKNYHIPALIVNLPGARAATISSQCSQIDLFPTLFALLHWDYESDFFGRNVLDAGFRERALIGTYRKLALLKRDRVMVLGDGRKQNGYRWNAQNNRLSPLATDPALLAETIAWYQTADYLFTNRLLR